MKNKPYLVSCGVFKDEIDRLSLARDYNIIFLGMDLHLDYTLLKQSLTKVFKNLTRNSSSDIILLYGDYCLGLNGEMNELVKQHGVVKVDALNCIDCFLGGGGSNLKLDPEDKTIFLSPGWIKFFNYHNRTASAEEQNFFKEMFGGFKGIILLNTMGNLENYKDQIQDFVDLSGLKILGTIKTDDNYLKQLIIRKKSIK